MQKSFLLIPFLFNEVSALAQNEIENVTAEASNIGNLTTILSVLLIIALAALIFVNYRNQRLRKKNKDLAERLKNQ